MPSSVEATPTNQIKKPITPDEAKAWFGSSFGASLTLEKANSVTTNPYQLAQGITITPIWSQSLISAYMQVNPILFVPVQPIPLLDNEGTGYCLVFYRDSVGATQTKIQVYLPDSIYRTTHYKFDIHDFTGVMFQIDMTGQARNILRLVNGRFVERMTREQSTGNGIECADSDPGSCYGGWGRGWLSRVFDAVSSAWHWVVTTVQHISSLNPGGGGTGQLGYGFGGSFYDDPNGNNGGHPGGGDPTGGGLDNEFGDNGIFDFTSPRAIANYVTYALKANIDFRNYLMDNPQLGIQMRDFLLESTLSQDETKVIIARYFAAIVGDPNLLNAVSSAGFPNMNSSTFAQALYGFTPPGVTLFEGFSPTELQEFRVIPENGGNLDPPTAGNYIMGDGFYSNMIKTDDKYWFKVSDGGQVIITKLSVAAGFSVEAVPDAFWRHIAHLFGKNYTIDWEPISRKHSTLNPFR